jgi:hypothetical protein
MWYEWGRAKDVRVARAAPERRGRVFFGLNWQWGAPGRLFYGLVTPGRRKTIADDHTPVREV